MSDVEDLLAEVRKREPRRIGRGGRIALVLAGVGVISAIVAGATLAITATTSIAAVGLASKATDAPAPEASVDEADHSDVAAGPEPSAGVAADAVDPSDPSEPVEPAGSEAGAPVYDASTDIARIPRAPSDWPASELANAEVWLKQQAIIADCMLEQGYAYGFTPYWLLGEGEFPDTHLENIDGDMESAKAVALFGPLDQGLGDDYDWRNAGCVGYAVHVTGMDDAH
jgi:hypothetical protein